MRSTCHKGKTVIFALAAFFSSFSSGGNGLQRSAPLQVNASESEAIVIKNKPYLTTLSLGDVLSLEGLVVTTKDTSEVIDHNELGFSVFDNLNLGKQEVFVSYGQALTSFNVFVTNKYVRNYAPSIQEVFISEILYFDNNYGIELYNGTLNPVALNNYELLIEGSSSITISLEGKSIASKGTFTIVNETGFGGTGVSAVDETLTFRNKTTVNLVKKGDAIDNFTFSWMSDLNIEKGSFRRNPHVNKPDMIGNADEWVFARDNISDFKKHTQSAAIVSVLEQAKAYARYVMFGAGMLAAGRVEEAFLALRAEFELMGNDARQYFIANKDTKVSGINEQGKSETVTFGNAHERIALLASRSGHKSFITNISTNNNTNKILIIVGLAVIAILAYVILLLARKKARRVNS